MTRCRTRPSAKGSPTGGQRTASAKRPKADQELTGPKPLAEIGALLDEVLHLTSVMQGRHINVTMKAMFSRMKSLPLLQPSLRLPPAKRAHGVQQMQRLSPKQREQGATDPGLAPKGQCRSNVVLAKRDTIVCTKSAIWFPAEKEKKSTRGACQKPMPPRKKQPREAALERTRPPPGERLLQKSGRESLTARTPL